MMGKLRQRAGKPLLAGTVAGAGHSKLTHTQTYFHFAAWTGERATSQQCVCVCVRVCARVHACLYVCALTRVFTCVNVCV